MEDYWHIPGGPEHRARLECGHAAVRAGTPDYSQNIDDQRTNVVDALANIMHYVHANTIDDFQSLVESAQTHFQAELRGE